LFVEVRSDQNMASKAVKSRRISSREAKAMAVSAPQMTGDDLLLTSLATALYYTIHNLVVTALSKRGIQP